MAASSRSVPARESEPTKAPSAAAGEAAGTAGAASSARTGRVSLTDNVRAPTNPSTNTTTFRRRERHDLRSGARAWRGARA